MASDVAKITPTEPQLGRTKGQRRVTMTDVATAAGCSQATVSFVLNSTAGVKISEDTRLRVIEAARSLGYAAPSFAHIQPNAPLGPATDTQPYRTVAFVVDQLATSPEAVVAIDGARQGTWAAGDVILVAQTMNAPEMEEKTIRALVENGADALVYMTIFTRKVHLPQFIQNLTIPVALLNCYTDDHRFPSAVPSEIAGGQTATQHLIDHGHRRIGHITGEPWMEAARDRLKGYRRALAAADIGFDPALVIEGNWSANTGFEATQKLLALDDPPTAIFCQNDRMAVGCYEALKEAGIRIPQDVSVVGYDDEEISLHLHPQLTTLILPHRTMGQWAVAQRGLGDGQRYPILKVDCPLVRRSSVAKRAG
ncbi:LacI family DNA-binding transcriptional regulator [Pseudorhodobacter sp.]|uniref:LacI family DNA-binding transcriptional regulator n=1 Tax=Pseudorhodobacter sp. TaxID=1934400 RepID=UPI0026472E25|nr:LacI family DNA-binding transcriptional regulator [Pseudorhodobacter sp.]MDN5786463.1 LacI family DNA-binding transcriptional regulator [Pseudorhodobacter sp.]